MKLTPEQLHILQHSLGCDQYGRSQSRGRDEHYGCHGFYRNHYVSDPTPDLSALVSAGYMTVRAGNELTGEANCYHVTESGVQAMDEQSPEPPKLTRGQQKYQDFLREDTGMSFGEWLKYDPWRKRVEKLEKMGYSRALAAKLA